MDDRTTDPIFAVLRRTRMELRLRCPRQRILGTQATSTSGRHPMFDTATNNRCRIHQRRQRIRLLNNRRLQPPQAKPPTRQSHEPVLDRPRSRLRRFPENPRGVRSVSPRQHKLNSAIGTRRQPPTTPQQDTIGPRLESHRRKTCIRSRTMGERMGRLSKAHGRFHIHLQRSPWLPEDKPRNHQPRLTSAYPSRCSPADMSCGHANHGHSKLGRILILQPALWPLTWGNVVYSSVGGGT